MRCAKHSFETDDLVDERHISQKCVNNGASWLWKAYTVKWICVIQILHSTLHRCITTFA